MTMKKKLLLFALLCSIFTSYSQAYTIAWVSEDVTSDASYITLLENVGYSIDATENHWQNLTSSLVSELNGYDLVIISKRTNSSNYGSDATVRANWQSVTTPIINMNNYINRSSRLEFFNTTVNNDNLGYYMVAQQTSHAIFTNTPLDENNTTLQVTTEIYQGNDATDAGNGTTVATDPTNGVVTIAEWSAGTACYSGAGTQSGKRMWYACSYSYNFTDTGNTLFLDAVEYMITGNVTTDTTTAINEEISTSSKLNIYPNPVSDYFTIEGLTNFEGMIFSVTGQKIKKLSSSDKKIDVSDFSKGTYIISIECEGEIYTKKFIKK